MIQRLRIRIILYSILAFALVIFSVSLLVNVVNYRIVLKQEDDTLVSILNFESGHMDEKPEPKEKGNRPNIPPFMGKKNPEADYITRFFIVEYNDAGEIINVVADNIAASSREETEQLARMAIDRKGISGNLENYRYLKGKNQDGNIVVFLNVMQDQQHLIALRLITLIVVAISLFIVSILVILFSGAAIKPIAKNIEKQKQFITDASHELKTPITSIVTSLDVLALDDIENEWTENIRNQSERMSKLVKELVTLSRLDETKPIYVREEFSLSDLAWEILETYQSRVKAVGREIKTDIEEGITLIGDKSAIGQMISVLVDNSIKYSKGEGDTLIEIKKKHNKIRIDISNPTDFDEVIDVNRLFDRFYRPDSSRNTDDGGSGIGLAIAKAVVEAHGGNISAKCPKGKRMIINVKL